jgi:two-component system chemotaxis response regulator CheB
MVMAVTVLLVEDSPVATLLLRRAIESTGAVKIVGVARTGLEALALLPKVNPDVICTDLHMPQMDGLALTREVMARAPKPILVISNSVRDDDRMQVFQLIEAGALDVFPKPIMSSPSEYDRVASQLIARIVVLSGVKVFTLNRRATDPIRRSAPPVAPARPAASSIGAPSSTSLCPPVRSGRVGLASIVAIGASTGGPAALREILGSLPATFPAPIVCVQHISTGFLQGLIDWLNQTCALGVAIARAGDRPRPGYVYFPPEGHQLEFNSQGCFLTHRTDVVDGHCPSVTVLFSAIARTYGPTALAALLTGMGSDGAIGLRAIEQAGGWTIAQDEASSIVFGMPRCAIELGAARQVLPLGAIAQVLCDRTMPR